MSRKPILIVDDVETHLALFSATLEAADYRVITARNRIEAREKALAHHPELALIDIVLPDGNGIDLIAELKTHLPALKPIAVTAFASVDRAVTAMRSGAIDFLVKPLDPEQLLLTIANAESGRSIGQQDHDLRGDSTAFDGHIGSSEVMRDVFDTINAVAGAAAPVFITGESGTGKVRAAETIHARSGFQNGNFIKLDCSTAAPDRIEAELIGEILQIDGRPDGRTDGEDKPGAVERARNGTLLLDEICALSLPMQARLLGILQSGSVTPLGGLTPRPVNFRLICTSTTDPRAEVTAGRFRADLFYRLNVVHLHLPPLRGRGMDVVEIAETELDRLCAREGRPFRMLSTGVKAIFLDHNWPGNLRELMNVLWNIAILHDGPVVEIADLPPYLRNPHTPEDGSQSPTPTFTPARLNPFDGQTLAEIERRAIEHAIQKEGGSIPAAARALGVSPSTLYRKLDGWGKPVRSKRDF
ncbi:sigma-54-dependent transcriptional regulator [Celeribacter sp. SCSIO 80788]|jgi:two-component system repressor protein LuxO|uniref:sigma-54-dependent transcriptional regulator n=1 Tax=Celeribacter sp. SCSIO 80788 TaxID=3117013 RepID=UPI003DA3D6D3